MDLNVTDRCGSSPLLHAAWCTPCPDLCQMLLDHGAQINLRNTLHLSAAHLAAERGHFALVKLLLKYGADLTRQESRHVRRRCRLQSGSIFNQEVHEVSVQTPNTQSCRTANSTQSQARIDELREGARRTLDELFRLFPAPFSPRQWQAHQLSVAVRTNDLASVRHALEAGALAVHDMTHGCTLLFHASWHGHRQMAHLLLAFGANVHKVCHDELDLPPHGMQLHAVHQFKQYKCNLRSRLWHRFGQSANPYGDLLQTEASAEWPEEAILCREALAAGPEQVVTLPNISPTADPTVADASVTTVTSPKVPHAPPACSLCLCQYTSIISHAHINRS
jgi:ankyrin repeat protein